MADVVNRETRSKMMSGIRSKNTKPEMLIRRGLYARGFRYRLHANHLPGKPDILFPSRNAVIFVHGCFWHGHDCRFFKWPKTREEFWRDKIQRNKVRDEAALRKLQLAGWRALIVWECALKGSKRQDSAEVLDQICVWLSSEVDYVEIGGIKAHGAP